MKVFSDVSTLGSSTLPIKHVLQEARTLSSHNTLKTTKTTKKIGRACISETLLPHPDPGNIWICLDV